MENWGGGKGGKDFVFIMQVLIVTINLRAQHKTFNKAFKGLSQVCCLFFFHV